MIDEKSMKIEVWRWEKEKEAGSGLTVDEVGKRVDDFCDVGRDNVVLKLES